MEKVEPINEEITLDFDIPESGYNWTKKQLDAFDARMRSGKIDKDILTKLLVELKDLRKKYGTDYPVSNALGYVFNVVIDKNLGNQKWRGYTPDWKMEMRDRAIELLIKHSHNFDPIKMQNAKNVDPYYYLAKITFCAFIQAHNKLVARHKKVKFVALNEATMSNYSSIDEFAIDANRKIDEEEKMEKENAEIGVATDEEDFSSMSVDDLAKQLNDDDYITG